MAVRNVISLYINVLFAEYSQYRDAVKRIAAIVADSHYNRIFYRSGEIHLTVNIVFDRDSLYRFYLNDNNGNIISNVCATRMCNVSNH